MVAPAARDRVSEFADMFAAMGTESRLRIMQLLLSAHPEGMVVGEIQTELGLTPSNLSHHLDKLKHEGLVAVQREGTFLRCVPGPNPCRHCWASSMRNAVPAARPSVRQKSPRVGKEQALESTNITEVVRRRYPESCHQGRHGCGKALLRQ